LVKWCMIDSHKTLDKRTFLFFSYSNFYFWCSDMYKYKVPIFAHAFHNIFNLICHMRGADNFDCKPFIFVTLIEISIIYICVVLKVPFTYSTNWITWRSLIHIILMKQSILLFIINNVVRSNEGIYTFTYSVSNQYSNYTNLTHQPQIGLPWQKNVDYAFVNL
jgi:hypothetical protein